MGFVDTSRAAIKKMQDREAVLREWLALNAPECADEQRHLDGGPEKAYWTYGYVVALRDVLALLAGHASASTKN